MRPVDRRTFLKTAAAVAAAAPALADDPAKAAGPRFRKAFMLGGMTTGPLLPHLEALKTAGFEGVELISPNELDRDEVIAASKSTGVAIHGVSGSRHWQDPLSDPDPAVVERGLAAIRQSIADVKAYGGTTVLLVPAVVTPKVSYRDAYERSQRQIRTLIPVAEEHGVAIAIEEVWNKFLLGPTEFARYVDEFQSPWVKAYFDVGNVVEYGYPQDWIRELGDRIVKIHIKEYAKPKRFDYKLGDGREIDWPAVRRALEDVGYEGWITAEVPRGDGAELKDIVTRMDAIFG